MNIKLFQFSASIFFAVFLGSSASLLVEQAEAEILCAKGKALNILQSNKCPKGQRLVDLSTLGISTPIGPKGDVGVKGDKGEKGEKGDKGDRGELGFQGLQGIQGAKGEKGEMGLPGVQGAKGAQGAQGIQGSPGLNGVLDPRNCYMVSPQIELQLGGTNGANHFLLKANAKVSCEKSDLLLYASPGSVGGLDPTFSYLVTELDGLKVKRQDTSTDFKFKLTTEFLDGYDPSLNGPLSAVPTETRGFGVYPTSIRYRFEIASEKPGSPGVDERYFANDPNFFAVCCHP